jgi:general secretion pathway protein D
LKSTARLLWVSLAIVSGLVTQEAKAVPSSAAATLSLATATTGQLPSLFGNSGKKDEKVRQSNDLLRQARAFMKQGKLTDAEMKIHQAEGYNVKYNALFHIGDTPAKARRDLAKLRAKSTGGPSTLDRLKSFGLGNDKPQTNPFLNRDIRTAGDITIANNSQMARTYMLAARKELIKGDLVKAEDFARRAESQKATLGPTDDSPEKIVAEIQRRRSAAAPPRSVAALGRETFARRATSPNSPARPHSSKTIFPTELTAATRGINFSPASPARRAPQITDLFTATPENRGAVADPTSRRTATAKVEAQRLTSLAREALKRGDRATADRLARQGQRLAVPDSAYRPGEDRPAHVLYQLQKPAPRVDNSVRPAGGTTAAHTPGGQPYPTTHAIYDPKKDTTRNRRVAADAGPPSRLPAAKSSAIAANRSAQQLYEMGNLALREFKAAKAKQLFLEAWKRRSELDRVTLHKLQDHLQLLSTPVSRSPAGSQQGSLIGAISDKQRVLLKQLQSDLFRTQTSAQRMMEDDPHRGLAMMQQFRQTIDESPLEAQAKEHMLGRCDTAIQGLERFIDQNRGKIELRESNDRTREQIAREKQYKLEVQNQLATIVEEYNKMMGEQRFGEAEQLGKKAMRIAPDNPLSIQLLRTSKLARQWMLNRRHREDMADGYINTMRSVGDASRPFDDRFPIQYAENWESLTRNRRRGGEDRYRTEKERQIEQKLKTPVSLKYVNRPLGQVMDDLAALTGVNLYLDPQGLEQEAQSVDTPVTINLRQEISLKSALKLILQPLHLSYVIKDEVLKITSESMRDGEVYVRTYDVAELVMPIPNFNPNGVGMTANLNHAFSNIAIGTSAKAASVVNVAATPTGAPASVTIDPALLAKMNIHPQQINPGGNNVGFGGGGGPGGVGGASRPDFDAIIDLIQTTISPTSWDEVGGPGAVQGFDTNLSLVISQTQEVHEQIVDLLEQLRRLQDLQVTIEVRFITLQDDFFERIGVDFDFNIDNPRARNAVVAPAIVPTPGTIGLSGPVVAGGAIPVTADLDIEFRQDSFSSALPQFGNFPGLTGTGGTFGFAILSDIEAFFFITAAQGDQRSNIMQAPKVTLFNGQQAFVSDTTQMPFVISVIPVVGDFAAANQPVVVVLSEGTFMTVQAVVSSDRRYVRLTIVPFFSQIGEVEEFTFHSERVSSRSGDPNDDDDDDDFEDQDIIAGTTVQLPSFSFVTVTTTVSVPDGGTVLLGGIKRLSEGRTELGVPLMNKIPYISRLFKNVGIGRSTQSLMMMVTPRIIIQEEEEERLGIQVP